MRPKGKLEGEKKKKKGNPSTVDIFVLSSSRAEIKCACRIRKMVCYFA